MNNIPKIFSIGLPKTGTMSLHSALKLLGYNSVHYPISDVIPLLQEGRYEDIPEYDAYVNCGEWHFSALDRIFPGSKFIYTWREFDSWNESIKNHLERYEIPPRNEHSFHNRLEIFGITRYDKDVMEIIYYSHKYAVHRYFKEKQNFLSLNVREAEAMENLCVFLDKNVVDMPFPHKNRCA